MDRELVLLKAKQWMSENIVIPHLRNTKKLSSLDEIKINPFLWPYLAHFYCGDSSPRSLATVAVLPRVLGTSITTSFGSRMQGFLCAVLNNVHGSVVQGIDIEYVDAIDGRKKYCQLKSGPQALNRGDVATVSSHFTAVKNLARTNHLSLQTDDLVFGLLYGEEKEMNSFIRELAQEYVVYIGEEFWYRLTGDREIYYDLANALAEVAQSVNAQQLINDTIEQLALEIEQADRDRAKKT